MEIRCEEDDTRHDERIEIRYEEDDMIKQLYEASVRGHVPTLNELIQKDPLLLNNISLMSLSRCLLHISATLGHVDFTISLLNYKSKLATDLDSHNRSALHLASAEGHTEIVKALLHVNNDVCLTADEDGRIPLHYAAMRGCIEVIQLLISERPESIQVKADREKTVLHLCVLNNRLEALKMLVEYVKDDFEFLNSKDRDGGNTILHLAVMLKQVETTKYLLTRPGIQKNGKNGIGSTALDVIQHRSRDFKSHKIPNLLDAMEQLIQKTKTDFIEQRSSDSKSLEIRKLLMNQNDQSPLQRGIQWLKYKKTKWIGSLGYTADWSKNTRDALMVVSTVITSTTFQSAINPPGGVWQEDNTTSTGCSRNSTCYAGLAVLAYSYDAKYFDFFVKNTISFIASICVIILLVSGVPLSNKFWSWLLTIGMTLTIIFMGLAYQGAMWLVTPGIHIDKVDLYNNRSFKIMVICLAIFTGFNTIRLAMWEFMKYSSRKKDRADHLLSSKLQVQISG